MKAAIILVSLLFVITPAADAGSGDAKNTSALKLSCSMGGSSFIVHVDLISCTANGFPANINEDTISWTVPGEASTTYTINRYTGDISRKPVFDPPPGLSEEEKGEYARAFSTSVFSAEWGGH